MLKVFQFGSIKQVGNSMEVKNVLPNGNTNSFMTLSKDNMVDICIQPCHHYIQLIQERNSYVVWSRENAVRQVFQRKVAVGRNRNK